MKTTGLLSTGSSLSSAFLPLLSLLQLLFSSVPSSKLNLNAKHDPRGASVRALGLPLMGLRSISLSGCERGGRGGSVKIRLGGVIDPADFRSSEIRKIGSEGSDVNY